ncbi:SEC-C metal-binding domain-containing protein, partial [Aphanothece microscopica]|uniref:SEC-C metal-binding domain-containing protein n=1 Tax=Aphanothece microscopica TaxID=1049561 RepID=UPI003984BA45
QRLAVVRPLTEAEQKAMMEQFLAQARAAQGASAPATPAPAEVPAPAAQAPVMPVADVADLPENWADTGRNDPCPCGSGKKFKHCHGRIA